MKPTSPRRIATVYFLAGLAWIVVVDSSIAVLLESPKWIKFGDDAEYVVFLALSTALVFYLCRHGFRSLTRVRRALEKKDEFQTAAFESLGTGAILVDCEGRVAAINSVACELTGVSEAAAIGRRLECVFPTQSLDGRTIANAFSSKSDPSPAEPVEQYFGLKTAAGKVLRVKVFATPIFDVEGVWEGTAIKFRDESRLFESETTLLRVNDSFRSLNAVNGIILRSGSAESLLSGVVGALERNRWIEFVGIHFSEGGRARLFESKNRQLSCCGEDSGICDSRFLFAEPGSGVAEFEVDGVPMLAVRQTLRKGDKSFGRLCITIKPGVTPEEIKVYEGIAMDLSAALFELEAEAEKERLLVELAAEKERAERANKAKDEFLAVMSHEMRTPLNPIMAYSAFYGDELEEGPVKEAMTAIHASSERLLRLVENILEFSSLDGTPDDVERDRFNPLDVCEEALAPYQSAESEVDVLGPRHGLGRRLQLGFEVVTDKRLWLKVLSNLLGNAVKFTKEGYVEVRCELVERRETFVLRTTVIDTGTGISESYRSKVFEPFTQAEMGFARRFEGAGLGLAVSQKIARRLGGEIDFESEEGRGSRFWFDVPVEVPSGGYLEMAPPERITFSRPWKVLLVDDHSDSLYALRRAMRDTGLELYCANDGVRAVELFHQNQPDIVFMDLSLPGMDGFEAASAIRSTGGRGGSVSIFALTAHAERDVKSKCLEAGMNGVIVKPVDYAAFIAMLSQELEGSSLPGSTN